MRDKMPNNKKWRKKLPGRTLCLMLIGTLLMYAACGAKSADADPKAGDNSAAGAGSIAGTGSVTGAGAGTGTEMPGSALEETAYEVAVRIRINPEMVLYLDGDHTVVRAELVNQDAEDLCRREELVGKRYDGALEYVVTQAVEKGYTGDDARVDVRVDRASEEADSSFVLEESKTVIGKVAEEYDMTIMATTNEVDIDIWQQYEAEQPENMPEFCGVCAGTSVCKNCHGTKKLLCGECWGDKELSCDKCHGEGVWSGACERCDSTGWEVCARCQGTGMMVCPRCKGTLIQACEWCQGDGKNHVTTTHDGKPLPADEYDPVCSKCKGTGTKVCRDCDNGYNPCSSDKGEKCDNGKTVCIDCGGTGSLVDVPCDRCEGGRISCPACEGNGETSCPYCSGSGKCADCGGTGIR